MTALIIAEHDHKQLKPATLNTVTAACELSDDISVVIASHEGAAVAEEAAQLAGVTKVINLQAPAFADATAEALTPALASLCTEVNYVLTPASTFGKNILPRLAATLDVGQVSDITAIIDGETFQRPIYAGNAVATVKCTHAKILLSVRATAFAAAQTGTEAAPIETQQATVADCKSEFVKRELSADARPDLNAARIVISGGRALASKENFSLIEAIADQLHAAIGASRAAVDAGYVPNDYQVGQTGKVIAPELYIAVGISGAIQHIAGMKDSKVIVAINKDPDAPIFKIANYGVVGDLFELLPQLQQAIAKIQ